MANLDSYKKVPFGKFSERVEVTILSSELRHAIREIYQRQVAIKRDLKDRS
jgi:hypothetical protein